MMQVNQSTMRAGGDVVQAGFLAFWVHGTLDSGFEAESCVHTITVESRYIDFEME